MEHQTLAPKTMPDPTDDPTLAHLVGEELSRRGAGLPAALLSQVVSEIAAELDALHHQGRTHGDVRAARIAVPLAGPAYLLESERPPAPADTGDDGNVVLHSLAVGVGRDVTGLVTAAYFALNGTLPDPLSPPPLPRNAGGRRSSRSPGSVGDVLAKGLALQSGKRYASAGAFAAALQAAASAMPSAPAEAAVPSLRVALSLRPLAVCAGLALGGGGLLALGVWLGRQQPMSDAPPAAFQSRAVPPVSSPALPSLRYEPVPSSAAPTFVVPSSPTQAQAPLRSRAMTAQVAVVRPSPDLPFAHTRKSRRAPRYRPLRTVPTLVAWRIAVPHLETSGGKCYLRVYACQFLSKQDMLEHHLRLVHPQRVLVDGKPSTSLAAGLWTPMAPGTHKLAFYPAPDSPFDPNANFRVRLGPRRQSFQIPLPRHPDPDLPQPLPRARATASAASSLPSGLRI